ncbi:MAG: hypothetical protein HY342_10365 [Candidatus Lambdaproteobacteria bacterium]|nr:hypothetical protein [Candidatus Lambdaproteobacteria bacterium]
MQRTGSQGLLGIWADIDGDYLPRFQEWHNCEHIPERVNIPGFNVGRRYRGVPPAPLYFMFYETDSPAVLSSAPYLAALNHPSPWTTESLTHFRNTQRNIYALLGTAGAPAPLEAPYLFLQRFNLEAATEDELRDWLVDRWLPALAAVPQVFRSRLYQADEGISAIMTAERKIYGGGPGAQKYLALCETACPHTAQEPAWQAAEAGLPGGAAKLARRRNLGAESFWLEIALYAP